VERRRKHQQGQWFVGPAKRKNALDQGLARVDKPALRTGLDLAPVIADRYERIDRVRPSSFVGVDWCLRGRCCPLACCAGRRRRLE